MTCFGEAQYDICHWKDLNKFFLFSFGSLVEVVHVTLKVKSVENKTLLPLASK